jgi:hypothetical protein
VITFDKSTISDAIARRAAEQKWRPDMTTVVSSICAWQAARPDAPIEYRDGQPGSVMQSMLDSVSFETGQNQEQILSSFGAAHCLLCDTVPGFRPVLFSGWDRNAGSAGHGH